MSSVSSVFEKQQATGICELQTMPLAALLAFFRELAPPSLDEMDGEFVSTVLDQGGRFFNVVSPALANLPGRWLGKAFQPVSAERGVGYNWFETARGIRRVLRMRTFVGPSPIIGGASYQLDYSVYNGRVLGSGRDEIRKVSDGLYLGLGRMTFLWPRHPHWVAFALQGPVGPCVDLDR